MEVKKNSLIETMTPNLLEFVEENFLFISKDQRQTAHFYNFKEAENVIFSSKQQRFVLRP